LSIVHDTVTSLAESLADFHEDGTTFLFSMPNRRAEDEKPADVPDIPASPLCYRRSNRQRIRRPKLKCHHSWS